MTPKLRHLLLPAALAAGALLATAAPAGASILDSALHGTDSHCYRIVAGPIRNDGTGWAPIVNDTHAPTGIGVMGTSSSTVTIRPSFTAIKVVSTVVTPDETLAKAGIFAGASVEPDAIRITMAKSGTVLDPTAVTTAQYPWGNLWVYGVFEVACG